MELQTLANLGEFIGGIGVLITLIYLAVQVRSNTRSQRNDIAARALERLSSMQREMATNADLNKMANRALRDCYEVNVTDRIRFAWWLTEFVGSVEFLRDQHRQGNVDDELWQRWEETYKWWLTFPGVKEWWRCRPTPFTKNFTAYTEQLFKLGYQYPDYQAWIDYLRSDQVRT